MGRTDFYQARYYDPHLGRFISADPLVPDPNDPQALNRYSYVRNNPLIYIDPTGNYWGETFFNPIITGIADSFSNFFSNITNLFSNPAINPMEFTTTGLVLNGLGVEPNLQTSRIFGETGLISNDTLVDFLGNPELTANSFNATFSERFEQNFRNGNNFLFGDLGRALRTGVGLLTGAATTVRKTAGTVTAVHGEFLIMRPLGSETIPDNVTATQNALGLQVAVGLSQLLPLGFGDAGSDESESHCHTL